MYFNGELSIDPSQLTVINRVKPTKAFGKLFYYLTAGTVSEKEEEETFTAISILQQINRALRTMGINNIVHLAKDDIDFYLDTEGREDDLKEMMEKFRLETDRFESELFENLYLVVEHLDGNMKYLIKISIQRIHKVGEYPIKISVNSVLTQFSGGENDTPEAVKAKMAPVFQSQENYDTFLRQKQAAFNLFLDQLELALQTYIQIDNVNKKSHAQIIRPKGNIKSRSDMPHEHAPHGQPIHYGYHGFDNFFFYAWMWSAMSHDHHIHYQNVSVVDEQGQEVFSVGEEGFNAGETDTMNPETEFTPPDSGDVTFAGENEYAGALENAGLLDAEAATDSSDSGSGWLDSFDFGSDSGGDSGSSCSSCSSCGGGCGGGCGGA